MKGWYLNLIEITIYINLLYVNEIHVKCYDFELICFLNTLRYNHSIKYIILKRKGIAIFNNTLFIFLPHEMLSHYIRDIYVSFGNTGYKTSEIYIDYHMNTIDQCEDT